MLQGFLAALVGTLVFMESRLGGQHMLDRPIIIGPLVGLVMGDPVTGLIVGGELELLWVGLIGVGDTTPPDVVVGSALATALTISTGANYETTLTLAIPISIAAQMIGLVVCTLNTAFAHRADRCAEKGDCLGVETSLWMGAAFYFISRFCMIFFGYLIGENLVNLIIRWIPQVVQDGLAQSGNLLPALGMAMLIELTWDRRFGAFLFLGFALAAFLGLGTVGVAAVGAVIAIIYYRFTKNNVQEKAAVAEEDSKAPDGKKLKKKTLRSVFYRHYQVLGCFNYERQEGLGYAWAMMPALRELYADDDEGLTDAMKRHLEFYSCTVTLTPFILGVSCAMEERNAGSQTGEYDPTTITAVKAALMGPLSGIGASFFWGTFRVLGVSLGAPLCVAGNFLGPIVYFILNVVPSEIVRRLGFRIGYRGGSSFLDRITRDGTLQKLTEAAKILGLTVIGGMISSLVITDIVLPVNINEAAFMLQGFINYILPRILPLALVFLCYFILKKKVSSTIVMIGLMALGVIGVALGLL